MISTYTLNHLGIVAGLCKELKIAETIDKIVPADPQQIVTTGQAVVAMIINGLGFSNRQLYLFPQFFEFKPVELLISHSLRSKDFNDDTLGRALDKLFQYGCTELFCQVANVATQIIQTEKKFAHLDTTTFSVFGAYNSDSNDQEENIIEITKGHSKQKRFDLNQIFLNMLVTGDGGVPIFMQVLDGNSNDSIIFRKTVTEFRRGLRENFQEITYWIADSSFYVEKTILEVGDDVCWISRVPERINDAKILVKETANRILESGLNEENELLQNQLDFLDPLKERGYSYLKTMSDYAGVKQRWLVIYSKPAQARSKHSVQRLVDKEYIQIEKLIKKLRKIDYKSKQEVEQDLLKETKKIKFHQCSVVDIYEKTIYKKRGRPPKNQENDSITTFNGDYSVSKLDRAVELEIYKKSLFIVATNELNVCDLTDQEVFESYKGQKHVERGFRFLKDPLFFASSLFVKKKERVVSLTMVMCLSLLVYSLGEKKLRDSLKNLNETINNQVNKPTQRPSLRWIFQILEDVHLIKYEGQKQIESRYEVKNLRSEGKKALKMLGESYREVYLLK